jgi:hypothetical protein
MSRIIPWVRVPCLAVTAGLLLVSGALAQEKAAHKYIGADKCKTCHMAEAKGNQYGAWLKSAHAKAFETLAGEKALAIAKEKGLAKSPQESEQCLKCHVTGWGKPAETFAATFKKEQGVSCESCHGPGSDYQAMAVMKDQAKSVAAGLIIPDEKTCTSCHNSESPTAKPFDFKTMWAKVSHPNPAKKKS